MQLEIRKVDERDLMLIFEWANDNAVRAQSFNLERISLEEHEKWFRKKIADLDCFFYIIRKDSKPLGQARFDLINDVSTISYSVSKEFRGMGHGKELLKISIDEFKKECSSYKTFHAKVKSENIASKRIFTDLGFSLSKKYDGNGLLYILNKK